MWEKTKNIRHQGVTFWKLPVLQLLNLAKGIIIGLGSHRFIGKRVAFLVSMVVLLRMELRMELNKASQRADQRTAKGLGFLQWHAVALAVALQWPKCTECTAQHQQQAQLSAFGVQTRGLGFWRLRR